MNLKKTILAMIFGIILAIFVIAVMVYKQSQITIKPNIREIRVKNGKVHVKADILLTHSAPLDVYITQSDLCIYADQLNISPLDFKTPVLIKSNQENVIRVQSEIPINRLLFSLFKKNEFSVMGTVEVKYQGFRFNKKVKEEIVIDSKSIIEKHQTEIMIGMDSTFKQIGELLKPLFKSSGKIK
ncbi:MAG TPA: hypothetical protein PKJ08_03885 [Candidatus Cloacimonadota bacterium]|nr:hypothetical protein [Candidatus Cloacimonadota bacterium]HPM02818.1 hypothetical protein [Candidatus Cloacimonadota bacterium]